MGCKLKVILTPIINKINGAIGIGAMIVFISIILIGGVAASVFIQTSSRLETQALKSGQDTIAEISIGLSVEGIDGHKSGNNIDKIGIIVRPRAGSSDIDLSETVIEISDSSTKNLLVFNGANFANVSNIDGDFFALAAFEGGASVFRVVVLEDADRSCSSSTPVIGSGDHIMLCINITNAFGGFSKNTDVFGTVIPEEGKPAPFLFRVPGLSQDTVFELF